jgi:hypothetical protein
LRWNWAARRASCRSRLMNVVSAAGKLVRWWISSAANWWLDCRGVSRCAEAAVGRAARSLAVQDPVEPGWVAHPQLPALPSGDSICRRPEQPPVLRETAALEDSKVQLNGRLSLADGDTLTFQAQ